MKKIWIMIFAALMVFGNWSGVNQTASAASNDVYDTPGIQKVNGREWSTSCQKYSSTVDRCWTYIWGDQKANGVTQKYWQFNNLTYLASSKTAWGNNPLAKNGSWTTEDGAKWRTECDTANTGRNGCRSYRNGVFNNIVRFTTGTQTSDKATSYVQSKPHNPAGKFVALPAPPKKSAPAASSYPSPKMTIHAWTSGGQRQIDQCKGAINYTGMNVSPWIAEHDYCGGKRFHKLKNGDVVKLTGAASGTYRVSSVRIFKNGREDWSHFSNRDGMIQTCVTGSTTMFAALTRIG